MFTSVVGTTFMYSTPIAWKTTGMKSTGTRSIRFIRKIQTNRVSASGAISAFLPWKVSLTLVSTNSTSTSTHCCQRPGRSTDMFRATLRNDQMNSAPSTMDQPMLSRLIAQKPISCASLAEWAMPQLPSG